MRFLALIALALTAFAQTPQFEVTSIRIAEDDNSVQFNNDHTRLLTHNVTLKFLVARAFDIPSEQIFGGPDWAAHQGYDIRAKMPDGLTDGQIREFLPPMLQHLLAERFQLVTHRETRQVSGFFLLVGKNGAKLEPAKPGEPNSNLNISGAQVTGQNFDMEGLARFLAGRLEAPVADKTGLKGGFNFKLRWSPDTVATRTDTATDAPPALPTAVQDQLGLKLESGKVAVSAVVIDSGHKPNAN